MPLLSPSLVSYHLNKAMIAVDPARSAQMALVRSRDTKPEMRVRRALHAAGLRYRLHAGDLPGKPDLVFRGRRIALFVHGCFWHQHPDPNCKLSRMPKSKLDFWRPKLEGNRMRDKKTRSVLEALGWTVVEIWECETKPELLRRLIARLQTINPPRTAEDKSQSIIGAKART
jgi:DNA mismatch endonuclease, patch repair protein